MHPPIGYYVRLIQPPVPAAGERSAAGCLTYHVGAIAERVDTAATASLARCNATDLPDAGIGGARQATFLQNRRS